MKLAILSLLIFLTNSQTALAAAAEETSKDISSHKKVNVNKPEKEESSEKRKTLEEEEEEDDDWVYVDENEKTPPNYDIEDETPNPAKDEFVALLAARRAALLHKSD